MPLVTIHLQRVNNIAISGMLGGAYECTDTSIATSGACATIASDAFMNPFDGELYQIPEKIMA